MQTQTLPLVNPSTLLEKTEDLRETGIKWTKHCILKLVIIWPQNKSKSPCPLAFVLVLS